MHVYTRFERISLVAFNMGTYPVPCLTYFNQIVSYEKPFLSYIQTLKVQIILLNK
jgi:hypothetical protein